VAAIAGFALAFPFRNDKSAMRKFLVSVPLLVLLSILSWQRAQLFAHPEQLWRDNLSKNPRAAMAWANLAEIADKDGRLDAALSASVESIRLDPGNTDARERYANDLAATGRNDEAIAEYRKILLARPRNARVHSNLGAAMGRKGLLNEAMHEFLTALQLAPNMPDAHKNLGAVFLRTGHYDEAIEQFEQALRIAPNFPGAREGLLNSQRLKAGGGNSGQP
jgi:tetratricopeptide (TPR) repeat protein